MSIPKITVKTTCPKCRQYYELDCEMTEKEISDRNTGKRDCPLCEEGIALKDR